MAPFNENFKGQGPPKLCPLCENFIDSQIHSFHCSKMISHIEINGRYEDIFKQKINKELLKTLKKILEVRTLPLEIEDQCAPSSFQMGAADM